FAGEITQALIDARDKGIDPELFEESRKREIGQLLTAFDDPDRLVNLYVTHLFHDLDAFERRELLDEVTIDEGQEFLKAFVRELQGTCSRVVPLWRAIEATIAIAEGCSCGSGQRKHHVSAVYAGAWPRSLRRADPKV